MTDLIPFQFQQHPVRIDLDKDGNPWWVAKDVCDILGLTNVSNAVGRLDSDEKTIRSTDNALIINEFGLYSLVLKSRKKTARDFQRWLTRRNGQQYLKVVEP
jgi:prophage antirepressor-like protein